LRASGRSAERISRPRRMRHAHTSGDDAIKEAKIG